MDAWLIENNFFTRIPGSYSFRKIGVRIKDGSCTIIYDGEFVWSGSAGNDAIGVIKEYLDL